MRIAMIQSDPSAGARAQTLLEDAGHEVLTCVDDVGTPFPCRGVAGGTCPLAAGAVVAVSAPASLPPEPQAGDIGLICAMRRHLPLVVVAPDGVGWRGARVRSVTADDLVAAVEEAASAVLPVHTGAVLDEVRSVAGEAASAAVTRSAEGLEVLVELPEDIDDRAAEKIAVRAQAAIRRVDPWAPTVDVRIGRR